VSKCSGRLLVPHSKIIVLNISPCLTHRTFQSAPTRLTSHSKVSKLPNPAKIRTFIPALVCSDCTSYQGHKFVLASSVGSEAKLHPHLEVRNSCKLGSFMLAVLLSLVWDLTPPSHDKKPLPSTTHHHNCRPCTCGLQVLCCQ